MPHLHMGAVLQHLRRTAARQQNDELSDGQLLERFAQRRDEAAFAALLRRHGPMVLGVCRGILRQIHDVEDAFQATFLILAQKAGCIRRGASVGGWLHEVAYNVALKAQTNAARREACVRRMPNIVVADPLDDLTVRELRQALHEELRQLPEKYRLPLIVCYLEGKTQEEAARQLGWPRRRVKDRLQRGREQLRRRLQKRGLAPVAALGTALFAADEVSATVPAVLAAATLRSAVQTTPLTPAVAALVEKGVALVSASKVKGAMALLLAVSLVTVATSGSLAVLGGRASGPLAATSEPSTADKPAPPKTETAKSVEIQGRVLGPDGKPKAGAKLLWFGEDDKIHNLGVSAADGSFTVAISLASPGQSRLGDYHPTYLIAQGKGDGIDFVSSRRLKPGNPVELRLVKDRLIRGRIINTEGQPVAGAQVAVHVIQVYEKLDTFLTAWMKWHAWQMVPDGYKRLWSRTPTLLATTTDADGRFVVHGAGDERYVSLSISGAGIANADLGIVNRAGFDPKPYNQAVLDKSAQRFGSQRAELLHGPDVTFVADVGKIIRGTVKAADTGKGQPGAAIWLTRLGDDLPHVTLQTKTDAEGRYEIRGVRKAKKYALQVLRNPVTGYMGSLDKIEDTNGYQSITADVTIKKGVIVTGKVIDRVTRQALPGSVTIFVLSGNPFAKAYTEFGYPRVMFDVETGVDGTFREVAIPGPILLMGEPDLRRLPGGEVEWLGFKNPVADPKYPQYFQTEPPNRLLYLGLDGRGVVHGNACKVLDLKPGTTVVHQDIFLDRENGQMVRIQDAEGRPLRGVWATGLRAEKWQHAVRIKDESCPVYGLESGKPRLMVFYERAKKLAGSRLLHGDENKSATVQLKPAGSIKGRLLDTDGNPLVGIVLNAHYRDEGAARIHETVHEAKLIASDANGEFTFDELIPELKFELTFHRGKRRFVYASKTREAAIQVKAGECRHLGSIQLQPASEKARE